MTHEQISKRAQEIWEREGRPEGRDREHWLQAEAELQDRSSSQSNGSSMAAQSAPQTPEPLERSVVSALKGEGARKRTARRSK